jgi:hypothetical protein
MTKKVFVVMLTVVALLALSAAPVLASTCWESGSSFPVPTTNGHEVSQYEATIPIAISNGGSIDMFYEDVDGSPMLVSNQVALLDALVKLPGAVYLQGRNEIAIPVVDVDPQPLATFRVDITTQNLMPTVDTVLAPQPVGNSNKFDPEAAWVDTQNVAYIGGMVNPDLSGNVPYALTQKAAAEMATAANDGPMPGWMFSGRLALAN